MKRLLHILFLLIPFFVSAQNDVPEQRKILYFPYPDSLILDINTVVPGSIKIITGSGSIITSEAFRFDINTHQIIFLNKDALETDSLIIRYKAMSINISEAAFHKDSSLQFPELNNYYNPFELNNAAGSDDWLQTDGLDKSGSITRGFSIGNKQDASLNSSLNLQLSGKLNNDLEIQAVISDDNIPIQPDGNTQQIQEFDKVFIRLQKDETALTAGDISLFAPQTSYFMKYNRKSQGGDFNTGFSPGLTDNDMMKFTVSGAFGKGKYMRQTLNVMEGNQGPYKLTGNNNETFIIVLAGSEKVHLDGRELERGQENDYIIDYNTAEIVFTSKIPITANSRIVVEFEYSDKNFARAVIASNLEYQSGKFSAGFSVFSEKDLKNQSIQQDLSDAEKLLLSQIGDSLQDALFPGIDSIGFTNEYVLYAMIDSLGYDSVFVYSTSPDSALYRLSFSYVGEGNGNYIQSSSNANGRVYKWLAPVAGIPQGTYEPVSILITPKGTEMYSMRMQYDFNPTTFLNAEYAISNNDPNLFSEIDDEDNQGQAFRLQFNKTNKLNKDTVNPWMLESKAIVEYTDQYFQEIQRFRTVEFDRDWNLGLYNDAANEYFGSISLLLRNTKGEKIHLQSGAFKHGENNAAMRNNLQFNKKINKLLFYGNGAYLSAPGTQIESEFLQHLSGLVYDFGILEFGIEEQGEYNRIMNHAADSLNTSSRQWWQGKSWLGFSDTSKSTQARLYYQYREDRSADSVSFSPFSVSHNAGMEISGRFMESQNLLLRTSFRQITYQQNTQQENEEYLLGRIEYNGRFKKRFLVIGAFYETGSGMEAKKEYSYLEVQPGQGVYTWIDYNENNVQELNEFEPAAFRDEANFIRIYIPTNDYIRVFTSQLSGNFILDPASVCNKKKKVPSFIARFHNKSFFNFIKKSSGNSIEDMYIPFNNLEGDTNIISETRSWRNVLSFNRGSTKLGINWTHNENSNRGLLVNGFENRNQTKDELKIIWNISKSISFQLPVMNGFRSFSSEYFPINNYNIEEKAINPGISWQNGTKFRFSILSDYTERKNTINSLEQAIIRKGGIELKFSAASKGIVQANFNVLFINYSGENSNSIEYIMLEGLKDGRNFTWNITAQRYIGKNLQLNLIYDARSSEGNPVIHTGNIQLRAFF